MCSKIVTTNYMYISQKPRAEESVYHESKQANPHTEEMQFRYTAQEEFHFSPQTHKCEPYESLNWLRRSFAFICRSVARANIRFQMESWLVEEDKLKGNRGACLLSTLQRLCTPPNFSFCRTLACITILNLEQP